MSAAGVFTSAIGPTIARYVAFERALGHRFDSQCYLLSQLDRFLAGRCAPELTPATFSAWCSSLAHLTPSGRLLRLSVVHRFCLYRRRSDAACFVPDPSQFPRARPRPRPHIFSEEEILRLLAAADAVRPNPTSPLCRQVARLAVVLAYTTGLRRGELVRLTLGDYDAAGRVLLVRDSKFHKTRLVPLSADAAREVDAYLRERLVSGMPRGVETALLLRSHGGLAGYTGAGLGQMLRRLFVVADVRTARGIPPRAHDLRFTFAIHALARLYRSGGDVQARLPALSTYMGHTSIASTQYYLPFVDEIAQQASERFERHCARFLAAASDERGGR